MRYQRRTGSSLGCPQAQALWQRLEKVADEWHGKRISQAALAKMLRIRKATVGRLLDWAQRHRKLWRHRKGGTVADLLRVFGRYPEKLSPDEAFERLPREPLSPPYPLVQRVLKGTDQDAGKVPLESVPSAPSPPKPGAISRIRGVISRVAAKVQHGAYDRKRALGALLSLDLRTTITRALHAVLAAAGVCDHPTTRTALAQRMARLGYDPAATRDLILPWVKSQAVVFPPAFIYHRLRSMTATQKRPPTKQTPAQPAICFDEEHAAYTPDPSKDLVPEPYELVIAKAYWLERKSLEQVAAQFKVTPEQARAVCLKPVLIRHFAGQRARLATPEPRRETQPCE